MAIHSSPIVTKVSRSFREKRFSHFLRTFQISNSDKILDVGGAPNTWEGSGLEKNVTLLNISVPQIQPPPFTWIQGDACSMVMFDTDSFDIVYSNSVIEHVGDYRRQAQMAKEITRVSKRYWVQTPYKHFPIEPHFLFPFFQYFPSKLRLLIAKTWPLSFAKRQGRDAAIDAQTIWLLDKNNMQSLFPNATIINEKFSGLTKSLVAYQK